MNEYITVNYETITTVQKRRLMEMMNSTLVNAFTDQDYCDVLAVFARVVDRLEVQNG